MINIPRQLIYQDRTELSDYLVGNELNQAIYDALKSIKSRSLMERIMGVPMLNDDDILAVFNDAYCLCIEMSCDAWFKAPDARSGVNTRFGYAWQVALLILSVQRCCNCRAERHLARYKDELSGPFLKVLQDFERKGRTFWADFTPVLPDIHTLELDWEVATKGFDAEVVKRTLRLWPSYQLRCTVARKMLDALRNSPRRDMPHLLMSARLLNRLINFWDGVSLKEWIRNRVEEHDNGLRQLAEQPLAEQHPAAEPQPQPEPQAASVPSDNSKSDPLFVGEDDVEDIARRDEEMQRFKNFVKEQGPREVVIDTKGGSFLNLAFVLFCEQWQQRGWMSKCPNNESCLRFLRACGFSLSVSDRAFTSKIRKMLQQEPGATDGEKLEGIRPLVEDVFAKLDGVKADSQA